MLETGVFLAEGDEAEMAVGGGHVDLLAALHERVVAEAVGYEVADADQLEAPLIGAAAEFGEPSHGSVVAHDLHEGGHRLETGEARQVDGRLGVAGALQHAAVLGIEGIDVAGASEGLGLRRRVGQRADRRGAVLDRHSGRAALEFVDGHREGGAEHRGVVVYLPRKVKLGATLERDRGAQHAARVLEHEVDVFGRDFLGGDDEVALVLAVLVVDHYHEFAVAEVLEGLLDAVKLYPVVHIVDSFD